MHRPHTVLLASKDEAFLTAAHQALRETDGYRLMTCDAAGEIARRLDDVDVSLLFCDADLDDDVTPVVTRARVSHPEIPRVVVASASRAPDGAGIARRAAAYLFMIKPALADQIGLVAKRALEMNELARRHRVLSRELKISIDDDLFAERQEFPVDGGVSQFEKMVYVSPAMADLVTEAQQAAATELPVLIHGETGTGKELLARAIHFNSPRLNQSIHVQNCGGMPDATLHSELFGHVRGAFTGAISDRLGLFRAADGGTVFLDEVSEISQSFQVSLLRFLQEGEVKPLGSDKVHHANVRIIAASNRSLEELVEQGQFRRDLFYRLKGFMLAIPPLRARREDIPVLVDFFIQKYGGVVGRRVIGVTRDALRKLQAHEFPGNVRELETEVRRLVAIAENGGYISARHLSPDIAALQPADDGPAFAVEPEGATLKEMVETLERRVVVRALESTRWNQKRAAEELGLSRVGLANKIKRYGLRDAT